MIIHRVMNEIFRSRSHIAVLRALLDTTNGYTGNHIARLAGIHPRSAFYALTSLESLGLVRRQRGGRDHLFTFNDQHVLVHEAIIPLFRSEQHFHDHVHSAIAQQLKRIVVSAVIFGSVAHRTEGPLSDLDLCCIVETEDIKETVQRILDRKAPLFHRTLNVTVAPLIFTVDEFRAKARSQNKLVYNIVKYGQLLVGKHPRLLLDDKTKRTKKR